MVSSTSDLLCDAALSTELGENPGILDEEALTDEARQLFEVCAVPALRAC
jgi:hypothetical protein